MEAEPAAQANLREMTTRLAELESQNAGLRAAQGALEKALNGSEKRFHNLLENVPTVAVQGYALDGTTRYWNRASTDLYGYTAAEAIGRNLLDLIIPDEMKSGVRAAMRQMAETGIAIPTGELSLRRKDGSRVEVISSHALVNPFGAAAELFCIDIDITERKRAEAALRTSEEGYRQLLQLSPEAIFIHRGELIFFANDAAVELFGAGTAAELIGLNWHRLMAPEYWQTAERRFDSLVSGELLRLPSCEIRYATLAGEALPAESTSSLILAESGPALMTVLRDISERKKIEEELLDYRVRLEDLVRSRTAELRAALQAAQLADQAKDAFLANVSHELRTPLGAVLGLSALAIQHGENPRQRAYLEKIVKAGKHLSRIINDLLDLSKIVAGRLEFETLTFSLRALLLHAQSVMAHNAEDKGLQLGLRVADEVPDVLVGDPLRLQQILLNLIGNAIKFTSAGRVEVNVTLGRREEHRVCLVMDVVDTGVGMSAEEMGGLFQSFAQADASMSRKYGGTGLGLAISRRLASLMDGDIRVSSCVGSGSTFSVEVWLELGDARDLPQEDSGTAETVHYREARVLVVDDHPMNREIVGELLGSVGISPHLAHDGREALDILAGAGPGGFDVVLMDIQMPVMDGLAATRELRRWPGFEGLPIVAMTAHAMAHEKQSSLDAGMSDHVSKPFDAERFYRMLAKWMPEDRKLPGRATTSVPSPAGLQALSDIDTAAGLSRFVGSEARYRHWLAKFVEESPGTTRQLRQAIASGDIAAALSIAHAFKGRVGMLGIGDLHGKSLALEAALHDRRPAEDWLAELERAIERTRAEIRAALGI